MKFKNFDAAVDHFAETDFKGMPRYMVVQYVWFGIHHPNILEKLMSGEQLNEEEKKIMDRGQNFKHTRYEDGDVIADALDVVCDGDATEEVIDKYFTAEEKPEDCEKVNPEDVPPPINNEIIREIMREQESEDLKVF